MFNFDFMSKRQFSCVSLDQALKNIIDSISREEAAIANLIDAESHLLNNLKAATGNINDCFYINSSISDIIKNLVRMQLLLQQKLEETRSFIGEDYMEEYEE